MITSSPSNYSCLPTHKEHSVKQHILLLEKRQKELRKELQLLLYVLEDLHCDED